MIAMITTTNRVREQNMACPEHFDGSPRLAHVHVQCTICAVTQAPLGGFVASGRAVVDLMNAAALTAFDLDHNVIVRPAIRWAARPRPRRY